MRKGSLKVIESFNPRIGGYRIGRKVVAALLAVGSVALLLCWWEIEHSRQDVLSSYGLGAAGFLSVRIPRPEPTPIPLSAPRPESRTAEQLIAGRLAQFARSRRSFAHALAKRHRVQVSGVVEHFFAAVESGDWEAIEKAFHEINGGDSSASQNDTRPAGVAELWPAIIDAYGVAEQVHLWPAQKLLDYGNAVLGALRPGMVYVGGTDEGRWIPELLNDTSGGDRHIVITQNGLAAADYLDYLRLQYDGQLANLTDQDSQQAFASYTADAQKRLEHDQQFPDQPKQLRPGEDVQMIDGKVQVSGLVAVMGINELLLQSLMQKNPDLSFAMEESFPLKGTYADAVPLGPLMELRATGQQNQFTQEQASQNLDYWRGISQQVLQDPEAANSETTLRSYSHNVDSAANLLAARGFSAEAEQAYQLSTQLWPGNPESVGHLADLMVASGRSDEARQLLKTYQQNYPAELQDLQRTSSAWHLIFR
jgi:hypothetical protein